MPVFHTKTIEAILEPVAQQVSQLVILHEEAEGGLAMPDLSAPVQAVSAAVQNLVLVGRQTMEESKDKVLKQEMPLAFTKVEESSASLIGATQIFKNDPYSPEGRKKLLDGARGILSGTSAMLLTFDEAEVRKIVGVCRGVIKYLQVAEVVERMEDLITFVKSLTPGVTNMAKQVVARAKELTHVAHADILEQRVASVKKMIPSLISSIKTFVTTGAGSAGRAQAQGNRNYVIERMFTDIEEIIRVLQLTTYDEDESDNPINDMNKAASIINNKMEQANTWLDDPNADAGGLGESSVRNIINQGRQAAASATDPEKSRIEKVCNELDKLLDDLAALRRQGKGASPEAQRLAAQIKAKLGVLQGGIDDAIQHQALTGGKKPNVTFAGKRDQVQEWLHNPAGDSSGLAQQAITQCVADARHFAKNCSGPERKEILELADETERLSNKLADLKRRGKGNSPEAQEIARKLEGKLGELERALQKAVAGRVGDDFMDVQGPLKQLERAAKIPPGSPSRDAEFSNKAAAFVEHGQRLADTAGLVANFGASSADKQLLDKINSTGQELRNLTPQVAHAARVLLNNPNNPNALEHFEEMKKQWGDRADVLTNVVDQGTDRLKFFESSEDAIRNDLSDLKAAVANEEPQQIAAKTSSAARRANRVVTVAQMEMDNSEDPQYIATLTIPADDLANNIPPFVNVAKNVATNPTDVHAQRRLSDSALQITISVNGIRKAVAANTHTEAEPDFPPPPPEIPEIIPAVSKMHMAEEVPPPPRPPPPSVEMNIPPRPPPPMDVTIDPSVVEMLQRPPEDNRMAMAAHQLHRETVRWEEQGNELVTAAKTLAVLFAKMSRFMSEDENAKAGSKKELIGLAKQIALESKEVAKLARAMANKCTDKSMRKNLLTVTDRIPTISTQLKIVATVKATMIGADDDEADTEATESLVGCAENLMSAVRQTVRESEAVGVKIRGDMIHGVKFVRRDYH